MTTKTIYAYTTGVLGTALTTYTNGYNSQNQLTNFNRNVVTYDSGNGSK